ncbi:DUF6207 family protein [Streptomyces paradoxus]|uniref:DUF6207 family protein n=1 Tax=Streptomyces paradoxus TaxID=66375 RepID=UPI0028A6858A|nr:DUF6207 family protein [Streptomyces paradoxus]
MLEHAHSRTTSPGRPRAPAPAKFSRPSASTQPGTRARECADVAHARARCAIAPADCTNWEPDEPGVRLRFCLDVHRAATP